MPRTVDAVEQRRPDGDPMLFPKTSSTRSHHGDSCRVSYSRTLEQTVSAKSLPQFDRHDPSTVEAWRDASGSFARGASGNVRVLLGDSGPGSIWNTVELPTLQSNPAVSSITAIDPVTGVPSMLWSR